MGESRDKQQNDPLLETSSSLREELLTTAGHHVDVYTYRDPDTGQRLVRKKPKDGKTSIDGDRIVRALTAYDQAGGTYLEEHPAVETLKRKKEGVIETALINHPSLDDYLLAHGPLPRTQVLDFATQLMDVVAWCHDHGVIHSDISDRNLLYNIAKNKLYLIDFGNSRRFTEQEQDNIIPGSTSYACPEHDLSIEVGFAADIFSTMGVLYKLICGVAPFDHAKIHDNVRQGDPRWDENRLLVTLAKLDRSFTPLRQQETAFVDDDLFTLVEDCMRHYTHEKYSAHHLLSFFEHLHYFEKIAHNPPLVLNTMKRHRPYLRDWSDRRELHADDYRVRGLARNISFTNLKGIHFYGDWSDFWFTHCNLDGADLSNACFDRVNLSHSTMRDAFLVDVFMREANMHSFNLSGSTVSGLDISNSVWDAGVANSLVIEEHPMKVYTDKHKGLVFDVQDTSMFRWLEGIDASQEIMSSIIAATMDMDNVMKKVIRHALMSRSIGCYQGLLNILHTSSFTHYFSDFQDVFYLYASPDRWNLETELYHLKEEHFRGYETWIDRWLDSPYAKIVYHYALKNIHPSHSLDVSDLKRRTKKALSEHNDVYPYFAPF